MSLLKIKLFTQFYCLIAKYSVESKINWISSKIHLVRYRSVPSPRQVLVLGGSFAGSHVAQRLSHSLPSGWRVVLVEKNSHFQYAFAFPQLSVIGGRESHAFIPYDGLAAGAPAGIFQHVQGKAKTIETRKKYVTLVDGRSIPYDYLVIATGAAQPPPTRLRAVSREQAISELQRFQKHIFSAEKIAVIGGGAAGIELVTEIKEAYRDKQVTLIHSRSQLLPRFGPKLHEYVTKELNTLGVEMLLGERPQMQIPGNEESHPRPIVLRMANGSERKFDLVIPCTGLRPNSELLFPSAPKSVSQNGEIIVRPTLQIGTPTNQSIGQDTSPSEECIFALGDVARTGGPKQGRSCLAQGEIVVKNILALIRGKPALNKYIPHPFESALQLTLGKRRQVMYLKTPEYEFLQPTKTSDEDVGASQMWHKFNEKPPSN